MPNGFTSDIYEGKDVSLRNYLMGVGRGMGYALMQRDEKSGPVKLIKNEDTWHDKALKKAQQRLDYLADMSSNQIIVNSNLEQTRDYNDWKEYQEEKAAVKSRYMIMLAQVELWDCPPILASTKETAIKYLKESLDFDCSYSSAPPEQLTAGAWHEREIQTAKKNIEYFRLEKAKEIANNNECNMYIKTFLDSLPND